MDFENCINSITNAVGKAFTKAEAQEMFKQLAAIRDKLADQGVTGADQKLAAYKEAAGQFVEKSILQAKIAKLRGALQFSCKIAITNHLKNYKNDVEGLYALFAGAENVRFGAHVSIPQYMKAARTSAVQAIVSDLLQLKGMDGTKSLADIAMRKGSLDRALAYHLAALTDPTVKIPDDLTDFEKDAGRKLAEVCKNHQNNLLNTFSLNGVMITPLAGRITSQQHNPAAMLKMGKDAWMTMAEKLFHPDTYDGKEPKDFLSSMYDAVTSGVRLSRSGKDMQALSRYTTNLAGKLSAERLVKFRDPDACLEYRDQMKQPESLLHAIISEIDKGHSNAALMAKLGPDPHGMMDDILRDLQVKHRTDIPTLNTINSILSPNGRIMNIFKELSGVNSHDLNPTISGIFDGIRAFVAVNTQALSAIKSIPDLAQGVAYLQHWGEPMHRTLYNFAKEWSNQFGKVGGDAWEQNNRQSWYFAEHFYMRNANRWDLDDLKGVSRAVTSFLYKYNGQFKWDEVSKYAVAQTVQRILGHNADFALSEIPDKDVKRSLFKYGVDSDAWDIMRQAVHRADDSGERNYITADLVQKLPDQVFVSYLQNRGIEPLETRIARVRNDMATKISLMAVDAGDHAITLAGPVEKSGMNWGLQKGMVKRGILDLVTHLKGYAYSSARRTFAGMLYGRGSETAMQALMNKNGEMWNGAGVIASGIAAWYIADSAKNAILGVSPRTYNSQNGGFNRSNVQNFATALAGSGGLGPYADLVTADPGSSPLQLAGMAVGPTVGKASQAAYLLYQSTINPAFRLHEHKKATIPYAQDMRFLADNTPIVSLPPLKQLLNYTILYHLENHFSPKANKQHEKNLQDETNQTYFYPPSKQ
jgi:hypothetical protein